MPVETSSCEWTCRISSRAFERHEYTDSSEALAILSMLPMHSVKLCTTFSDIDQLPELQDVPLAKRLELRSLYGALHLPQGAPTSPTLSNLIAYRLDARLTRASHSIGLTYTRYADDLLFSDDRRLQTMQQFFRRTSGSDRHGRRFSGSVSEDSHPNQIRKQEVAGVVINQHPNISRPSYDKLKAILHNCLQYGPVAENREQHPDFRSQLLGKISWIQQLNPVRGNRLLAMFQKIPWDLPPERSNHDDPNT